MMFSSIRESGKHKRNCKSMESTLWIVFHTVQDNSVELRARE
jgi:hypothetical protein